ncbi:hypothetical protein D4R87_01465 [bacterium]|nr:MAG: hypothetical protein D4R87_01465 [bacterium]
MIMLNQLPKQIILFFGPPGSGKGTQTRMLAEKFGLFYLGCGDILREASTFAEASVDKSTQDNAIQGKEVAVIIKKYQKEGKLVPTEIVTEIFLHKLKEALSGGIGVVLDGYPRDIYQAKALDNVLKEIDNISVKVILIDLNKKIASDRILKRKTCTRCKQTIPYTNETRDIKRCPDCGGELIARSDDTEETIQTRWEAYEKETKPLIDYYGDQIIEIDGEPEIEEIFQDIISKITNV